MSENTEPASRDDFLEETKKGAARLLLAFKEQLAHMSFKRGLDECLANQRHKTQELRQMYQEHIKDVVFLKASYFADFTRFERHQDIPAGYFMHGCQEWCFISHRWDSAAHPDPSGRQFAACQAYCQKLTPAHRDTLGFWYDFSCAPQRNADGTWEGGDEITFAGILKKMHLLTSLSSTLVLFQEGYLDRSWCCVEWLFSAAVTAIPLEHSHYYPFGNALKFRQLSLVVWLLTAHDEMKLEFFKGDDNYAMPFLNSLLMRTMRSTEATFGDDKHFLQIILHRHWWYHVRYLGLRSELMIGFLRLQQYDDHVLETWFQHFLIISGDPALEWTKVAMVDLDLQLLVDGDEFDDLSFHKLNIQVKPRTVIKGGK